ncbi:MAG: M28 family peptidase [candidate division Zixibacteria bacterium]
MKVYIYLLAIMMVLSGFATADDMYRVSLQNHQDAEKLINSRADPVIRINGDYLILANNSAFEILSHSGLPMYRVASNISLDELFLEFEAGVKDESNYKSLFEINNIKLYQTTKAKLAQSEISPEMLPVKGNQPRIYFRRPAVFNPSFSIVNAEIDLDSLINLVSQDTIMEYSDTLQAFNGRLTGTPSIFAARDWVEAKFTAFGYDSVVVDSFGGIQHDTRDNVPAYNVMAYKIGTVYPDKHIVIGAHYDAVAGSPGADDNGSGTVGVIEFARILSNLDTYMTLVFVVFDSEESGLYGSHHYVNNAETQGEDIVYMLNMDMIAHIDNDSFAKLFHGDQIAYSQLWGNLADSLFNITGVLSGTSASSDHYPFQLKGYDVTFVHEHELSTVYHSPQDSTTYMSFDYMTKMIKSSLATAYVVDYSPPPAIISNISDIGDGQSLRVEWTQLDPIYISHYYLHYNEVPVSMPDSILIPSDSNSYVVNGLIEGQKYSFYLISYDNIGRSSIAITQVEATPLAIPHNPAGLSVLPVLGAINLTWHKNNIELDFSHYQIIRDGVLLPDIITDTTYNDNDPSLGSDLHDYWVVAFDDSDNMSDTTGVDPVQMKAATLEADRILALNRSSDQFFANVNEQVTGEFMRQALESMNYDYFSDSSTANAARAQLISLLDYGIVVIGAESGNSTDDIGGFPGDFLNDLSYYLSIGGKVVAFGRWGTLTAPPSRMDTVFYNPNAYNGNYYNYFNTAFRVRPTTEIITPGPYLVSDFVGANSQILGYPSLDWDSTATVNHISPVFIAATGIPSPSLPGLFGTNNEVIYTYNSSMDTVETDGKPIAWRHIDGSRDYVFFDIPLSFMERTAAVSTLQKAINDLMFPVATDEEFDEESLPTHFTLSQNYPNPFNPQTTIEFFNPYNLPHQMSLKVFNIIGQEIKLLFNDNALPGITRIKWDGTDNSGRTVASGIYFYQLKTDDLSETKKMLFLK